MLYFLYRKYIIGKDGILLLEGVFVTITGFRNYYDKIPFSIGARFLCAKEPGNAYDTEAIRVLAPNGHTVGYVANSVHTKANGTMSAARVYDLVGDLIWREFFSRSPRSSAKSRILMFQQPPQRFPCSAADPKTNGTRKTEPQLSPPPPAPQRRGFFCQQPLFSFVF